MVQMQTKADGANRLVIGGHSFIAELGNDPPLDFDAQLAIVSDCLDAGVTCIDTTYEPERVAVGRILETLGRRDEAQIIAWNFFTDEATGEHLVWPRPFEPHHLEQLLDQLRTDHIDMVVVHPVGDAAQDAAQTEVACAWVEAGRVGALGTWAPGNDPASRFSAQNPFRFMVTPRNIQHPNTEAFRAAKALGWETYATSPFNRGWLLDALVAAGAEPAHIADALLRFSLHDPTVDRLIVGIRKPEWIRSNLESVNRGPLSEAEQHRLFELLAMAALNR